MPSMYPAPTPTRRRLLTGRRIALLLLLFVPLLPVAAYSLWWWQAARMVEDGVANWIADQRANGAVVEHRGLVVAGFPFTLRAVLEQPHLATRGADWQGSRLVAQAAPWNPTQVALSFPGLQKLSLAQPGQPPVELTAPQGGSGEAVWRLSGSLDRLALRFTGLTAEAAGQSVPVDALDVTASQPEQLPAGHDAAGLSVTLAADGLTLPDGAAPPALGRQVRKADLKLRVMGRPPRPEPASLSAWSRDGGTVELDRLALDWGPLGAVLSGTLALDPQLQPQAALTAEIRGAPAVLDAVKPMMRPNEAAIARTVLTMLSRPTGPNGEPVLTAPVTVQDRALFVGPLRVAALPKVVW
ncbi:DUF2125 domain-containing protein [Azospirillum picis]|uniref:DUF2125 domain-containing protein n=1 Tax=Azospirillum picis TaxID=488438 RepID=A0ABU0MEC9_9PROT|nr:DUF2125 domain-containing protein [Azospirillum picis]MBP2297885.1 hypothetical protein [Azospirillum picis]MDQ0531723.1 hypothetical protein [Azospirillum picis]